MNLVDKTASPSSKLDAILIHLCTYVNPKNGVRNSTGGTFFEIADCYANLDPAFFGLASREEMSFYLRALIESGYIKSVSSSAKEVPELGRSDKLIPFPALLTVTFKGIDYLFEIEKRGILSNKCFVAMAFDSKKEPRLAAIKSACMTFEFDANISEGFNVGGNLTIDEQIISAIKSSRFCIADFTDINAGAYMEAGFAMGRNMKVIFVCEEKDFLENKKHFDVSHYPFKLYKTYEELTQILIAEIGAYITD